MPKNSYQWKRFWCPRNGQFNLSDDGYLFDPDSEYGKYVNPDLRAFDQINSLPCLVLLGEPGIGKSTALDLEISKLQSNFSNRTELVLRFDLRSFGSEDRLIREVFQNETVQSWLQSSHKLHLFLDSFDECLLRINTVAALLSDELKKLPTERLLLRITSRTSSWPVLLEESLLKIFGEQSVGILELVPLRKADVAEACRRNSLNENEFLEKVSARNVVSLAIKPVTLQFLINKYSKNHMLPSNQSELYYDGCRILCEETNQSRIDTKLTGEFSSDQRLAVAGRIAAAMIFGNKYAVWTAVDMGDVRDEDITTHLLEGGTESTNGSEFGIGQSAIAETLSTGLFSSRGQNQVGWAHQTYAEYLAARYLLQKKVGVDQIMDLLIHPDDPSKRLVPQLHETAAWLASMDLEIAERILKCDPEVLLHSDVQKLSNKSALVDAIVRLSEEGEFSIRQFGQEEFSKLAHSGLAEQLRSVIFDLNKKPLTHRLAINIARACNIRELQEDLANVALDQSREIFVRNSAAHALAEIGDTATRLKLKPLAEGNAGDDPDDELKGAALHALWPDLITVQELFSLLSPPKNNAFLGSYHAFVSRKIIKHLSDSDLLEALKNMEQLENVGISIRRYQEFGEKILKEAWNRLDVPGMPEAFAKIVIRRLREGNSIIERGVNPEFANTIKNDYEKRRKLLKIIVNDDSATDNVLLWLTHQDPAIAQTEDVIWMISQLLETADEDVKKRWVSLIQRSFMYTNVDQRDAVLKACEQEPLLHAAFWDFFEPVELGSERAQKMKKAYEKNKELENRVKHRPLLDPPPEQRVNDLLNKFDSENLDAWWILNLEMTLEPDSKVYFGQLELAPDLTHLYGWKSADAATRERIVAAAKKYLLEKDPLPANWLGKSVLDRPAFAGYRALLLLYYQSPDFLTSLPDEVWRKWAAVVVAYPLPTMSDDAEEPHRQLVKMAYDHDAQTVIAALEILIEEESNKHDNIYIIRKMKYCWDEQMGTAMMGLAAKEILKPSSIGSLLDELLKRNVAGAKGFVESMVAQHSSGEPPVKALAVQAAVALSSHADDSGWPVIWPTITKDSDFAQAVIPIIADRIDFSGTLRLNERQIEEFYIYLMHKYPMSGDDENQNESWVTPRGHVAHLRDGLLSQLKNKGTFAACDAIENIIKAFPNLDWLKYSLVEARKNARLRTWKSASPKEIIELCKSKENRLLQSGDHLLQIVTESLAKLEQKLQGETPMAMFLWNDLGQRRFSPKDENALSDFIKQHLEDDLRGRGIIMNREVQIRRRVGVGGAPGETTDIHVDAISKNGDALEVIKVIVEVKGCWNNDLGSAMDAQLVSRYLKENQCHHGIYLVGWFDCPQWDKEDFKKRHSRNHNSIGELQQQLNDQAHELSNQQELNIVALILNCRLR